jgi:hypothetical protein
MVQENTAGQITGSLLAVMPAMDANMQVSSGNSTYSVDHLGFEILAKANPGKKYYNLLVKLLGDADEAWGKRILWTGAMRRLHLPDSEIEPLFQWIEENAFAAESAAVRKPALAEPSAVIVRALLRDDRIDQRNVKGIEERFLPLIEKSPHISPTFLLTSAPTPEWSIAWRNVVSRRALKALKDPTSSAQAVTQASMILASLLSSSASAVDPAEVADAVRPRLPMIAGDSQRLWQLTAVGDYFGPLRMPQEPAIRLNSRGGEFYAKASEAIELMDLIAAIKGRDDQKFELAPVVSATKEAYLKVIRVIPNIRTHSAQGLQAGRTMVDSIWPTLDSYNVRQAKGARSTETIDPTTWLGFLICTRAAELGEIPLPTIEDATGAADFDSPAVEVKN